MKHSIVVAGLGIVCFAIGALASQVVMLFLGAILVNVAMHID